MLCLCVKVALAQLERERGTLGSAYEAKYLSLIQEMQKHVSSFQDSVRETESELEGVREEFAATKRAIEVKSRPSGQVQEWEDEVGVYIHDPTSASRSNFLVLHGMQGIIQWAV